MIILTQKDLYTDRYIYSTTETTDYRSFTEYLEQANDIAALFALQADGNATIFRTVKKQYAQLAADKNLREPFMPEQVTITLDTHIKHITEMAKDLEASLTEMEEERDELQDELDKLNDKHQTLKAIERDNQDLTKTLYDKTIIYGYSAKEALNEIFRDNSMVGTL